MGAVLDRMEVKLRDAFSPELLEIEDQSEQHRGHGGFQDGGETHFHVRIISAKFANENRVNRQRSIYATLAEEIAGPIHALSIEARAPGE